MNRTMLGFSPGSVEYGFVLNSTIVQNPGVRTRSGGDRLRVVALGDSFTFASGALPHEDHWTTLLEEELGGRSDRPVEVLRLGVPDTGPAFQLRLWQVEASKLEPDVVVMAFFVGNDFIDHQGDCGVFGGGDRGLSGRLASVSALYRAARNPAAGVGRRGRAARRRRDRRSPASGRNRSPATARPSTPADRPSAASVSSAIEAGADGACACVPKKRRFGGSPDRSGRDRERARRRGRGDRGALRRDADSRPVSGR